jgi:hypothetical protein
MSTEMIAKNERACTADVALGRIVAEITAGMRHGYFDLRVTCDVIGHGRRRLILHAGKNYQFVIPAGDCERADDSEVSQGAAREGSSRRQEP